MQKNKDDEEKQRDVRVILVEYTKGKVYYSTRNRFTLTYCHKYIGVIQEDQFLHHSQNLSFKSNEKDQQTFNERKCREIVFIKIDIIY